MSGHIVACGGGGWSSESGIGRLEDYILGLASGDRPRVCLLPTASGDSDWLIARFYETFSGDLCRPSHQPLFRAHPARLEEHLRDQDVIYVGGGSSANLMAVWAVHRMEPLLRRAWEGGVVLAGVSAGAICWFATGLTNSLGPDYAPVQGLGFVEGGFCPHADGDPGRVPALKVLIDEGRMPPSFAVDDDAAIHIAAGAAPRLVPGAAGRGARWIAAGGVDAPLTPLSLGV